jgi:Methyltransferase domain
MKISPITIFKIRGWHLLTFPLIMMFSLLLIIHERLFLATSMKELPLSCDLVVASSTYELAKHESLGFFDDIDSSTWHLHKNRAQLGPVYAEPEDPNKGVPTGAIWLLSNVDPLFTCPNLRRVGGLGDGPKWTCDPHRLAQKPDCLIYSVGSFGIYLFEDGIVSLLKENSVKSGDDSWFSNCEIHVFDPNQSYARKDDAEMNNIHYHAWGLKSSYNTFDRGGFPESYEFLTFAEIRQRLGHENRRIDIFKIDCEGCEFSTYRDWLDPSADIRQILVETHGVPEWSAEFFDRFFNMGFVLFAKEANTHPDAMPAGQLYEWGWFRMHPDFMNQKTSLIRSC